MTLTATKPGSSGINSPAEDPQDTTPLSKERLRDDKSHKDAQVGSSGVAGLDDRSLPARERLDVTRREILDEIATASTVSLSSVNAHQVGHHTARLEMLTSVLSSLEAHGEDFFVLRDAQLDLEHSPDLNQRKTAAKNLGEVGGKTAARLLISAGLEDSEVGVRAIAARALENHPHKFVAWGLVKKGLTDSDANVVKAAETSLHSFPEQIQESVRNTEPYLDHRAMGQVKKAFDEIAAEHHEKRERFLRLPGFVRVFMRSFDLGLPPDKEPTEAQVQERLKDIDPERVLRCMRQLDRQGTISYKAAEIFKAFRGVGFLGPSRQELGSSLTYETIRVLRAANSWMLAKRPFFSQLPGSTKRKK